MRLLGQLSRRRRGASSGRRMRSGLEDARCLLARRGRGEREMPGSFFGIRGNLREPGVDLLSAPPGCEVVRSGCEERVRKAELLFLQLDQLPLDRGLGVRVQGRAQALLQGPPT